ncbi:MAG: hypothetical protein WCF04_02065 [Candidatus Nanopelagicales bacterium]
MSSDGLTMFLTGPTSREEIVRALMDLNMSDEGNDPGVCIDAEETLLVDVGIPHPPIGSLVHVLDISVDVDDPARDDATARRRVVTELQRLHPGWQFELEG